MATVARVRFPVPPPGEDALLSIERLSVKVESVLVANADPMGRDCCPNHSPPDELAYQILR